MDFIINNIWFILFFTWGLPLGYYRSKFRKIVYQTDSWVINIKPLFWRELRGLFGNLYPENVQYKKFRNFYSFYLVVYLVLFVMYFLFNTSKSKDMEMLTIGSTIPSFELQDQHGNLFNIDSVAGKKNLVIYFYPKDDSPGCSKEACSFRDQFEQFTDVDAMVIGISSQSVESHLEFAEKHRLNYTLLSDTENDVRKLFGVKGNLFGLIPGRVTFVFNKDREVIYMFDSQFNADKHVETALEALKGI